MVDFKNRYFNKQCVDTYDYRHYSSLFEYIRLKKFYAVNKLINHNNFFNLLNIRAGICEIDRFIKYGTALDISQKMLNKSIKNLDLISKKVEENIIIDNEIKRTEIRLLIIWRVHEFKYTQTF